MEEEDFVLVSEESDGSDKNEKQVVDEPINIKLPQEKLNRVLSDLDYLDSQVKDLLVKLPRISSKIDENIEKLSDSMRSEISSKLFDGNCEQVKEIIESTFSERFTSFSMTKDVHESRIRSLELRCTKMETEMSANGAAIELLKEKNEILEKQQEILVAENKQLKEMIKVIDDKLVNHKGVLHQVGQGSIANEAKTNDLRKRLEEMESKFQNWEDAERKIKECLTKKVLPPKESKK